MLKIGDFSRLSRVTVKALRYYDEIGLLKPVKVDRFTGYRYYSAEQLPRLNRILGLKNLGLSLEEIAWLLADNLSPQRIQELMKIKQAEMRQRLDEEKGRLVEVEGLLKQIEQEGTMPAYDNVVLKKIDPQKIVSIRDVIPTYADVVRLWEEFAPYLEEHGASFAGPALAIYYDMEFREKDVDIEIAVPITGDLPVTERIKVHELPGIEQAACVIHQGPYETINQSYTAMMAWAEANGYQISGPDREVYLTSPNEVEDPQAYVTELQIPVAKA